jgi:iron(III) transport system substrate-binding protein
MKFFISFILIFSMLLVSLAAAQPAPSVIEAAKKEKKLVWWGSLATSEATELIKRFNQRYPFIQVEHWRGTGEATSEKIHAEFKAKRYSWDVVVGAETSNVPDYIKMGIIEKWSVPGLANVHKEGKDPKGYTVIFGGNVIVPAYNTSLVSANDIPKSWDDLVVPKWKGKISLTNDVKVWVILSQSWGKEKTKSYVTRLAANKPQIINGHTQATSLLAAGEFPLTAEVYLYRVRLLMKKGAPIDWARVNPVLFTGSSFMLSKNAPHPNAAYLWLDWLFSLEGLKATDDITGKGNPYPGSGTQQAEAVKGLSYLARDDRYVYENKQFTQEIQRILGIQ